MKIVRREKLVDDHALEDEPLRAALALWQQHFHTGRSRGQSLADRMSGSGQLLSSTASPWARPPCCMRPQAGARRRLSVMRQVPAFVSVLWASDHQLATPGLAALAGRQSIGLTQRSSDHAPQTLDHDLML
jgi:hypothetical protein